MRYLAAVVQTTSTPSVEASMGEAEARVRAAAGAGARLVALPEGASYIGPEGTQADVAEPLDGPVFARWSALARELGIVLSAGTSPERSPDPDRPYNTAVVFGPDGARWAVYRKLHLFDVDLSPEGPRIAESDRTRPGDVPVLCSTPFGRLGLTVCYDLRFGRLYEDLVAAGAELLLVPSAFTVPTGRDHWEVLLRARAIEFQCWVLAAAQVGRHCPGRRSYGRSIIVDPWGTVVATVPDGGRFALAEIDLDRVKEVRRQMPRAAHLRALPPPDRQGP